ncbi:hypothetical protein [Bordetella sp. 2513F-2]
MNPFLESELNAAGADQGRPRVGPSDSSDGPSDRPQRDADTDSDAQSTGERPAVNPRDRASGQDVAPDEAVDADEAGLARTPPDPARNGGDAG